MFQRVRDIVGGGIRTIASAVEGRGVSIDARLLAELRGKVTNLSGVNITPDVALSFAAFFASVNVIGTDTACLPLRVYQRIEGGGRRLATEKRLDDLLYTSPDNQRTSMGFRQSLMLHVLTRGNAHAEVDTTYGGEPGALHLLPAGSTRAETDSKGRVFYPISGQPTLPASKVLHVAGLGWDGLNGLSTIRLHSQGIGLGKAQETTGAAAYGNGNRPGGFLKIPAGVKDTVIKNLLAGFENRHSGPDAAYRIGLLEGGMEFQAVGMSMEDAQYIESRRFQIMEMARIFRLPPNKLGDYGDAHLNNIEASNLDYLVTTLMPWLVRIEQSINLRLFTQQERRQGFYVKHNMNAFLRGDMAARAEFYTKMFAVGYSVDEIRESEDWNPVGEKAGGSKHFVPLNMVTLDRAGLDPVSKDASKRKRARRAAERAAAGAV